MKILLNRTSGYPLANTSKLCGSILSNFSAIPCNREKIVLASTLCPYDTRSHPSIGSEVRKSPALVAASISGPRRPANETNELMGSVSDWTWAAAGVLLALERPSTPKVVWSNCPVTGRK